MKLDKVGRWCRVALLLTITLLIWFLFVPQVASEQTNAETALETESSTTTARLNTTKTDTGNNNTSDKTRELPQVLLAISWCESRDDQNRIGYNYRYKTITLADGSTTTEKYLWSRDIGRFQINDYYHAEAAKALGMDIYTVEGNTQYALVLYNSNGTKDWNPSKPCWSNIETYRAKEQSYY